MYSQKAADRKRKMTERLAGAATEVAEEITLWSGAATHGAKPMQDHAGLPEEFKEYIQWHNARREARKVRSAAQGALRADRRCCGLIVLLWSVPVRFLSVC